MVTEIKRDIYLNQLVERKQNGLITNPEKLKNTFRSVKKSKITAATVKNILIILKTASW